MPEEAVEDQKEVAVKKLEADELGAERNVEFGLHRSKMSGTVSRYC